MNQLASLAGQTRPESVVAYEGAEFSLLLRDGALRLAILADAGTAWLEEFEGEAAANGRRTMLVGPLSARNAAALRKRLPWLRPTLTGIRTSAGLGDRLGLATPGHIRALRAVGGGIVPNLAQQSIREMTRASRSAQQVLDDATWGAFEAGWREGYGADGDHLKEPADIDRCLAAGFTFFTFDPGEHVNGLAESMAPADLRSGFEALPWNDLEDSAASCLKRWAGRTVDVEGTRIAFDERTAMTAAVKYGRAVAQVVRLQRHLVAHAPAGSVEIEVSTDETETPTSHAEHLYTATELQRLGVRFVSLAPRFVGTFEKGVDYIGSLEAFEHDFAVHAAIARTLGPYKLSLHSGSDKFSIYPIAARQARGLVHLKTAGTSYLEALRTIAAADPELFREIYAFARERYETDRASYCVSGSVDRAPRPEGLGSAGLLALLEDFDARQVLHVTFGSVLTARDPNDRPRFAGRFRAVMIANPETYAHNLEKHFTRHLAPFAPAR